MYSILLDLCIAYSFIVDNINVYEHLVSLVSHLIDWSEHQSINQLISQLISCGGSLSFFDGSLHKYPFILYDLRENGHLLVG